MIKDPKPGQRIRLTYPDGTIEYGTIVEEDNNTLIVKTDEGKEIATSNY